MLELWAGGCKYPAPTYAALLVRQTDIDSFQKSGVLETHTEADPSQKILLFGN